ncbi:MAG TPA: hypothetical protein VHO69_03510 [Phototrophicaceae bacterium]|nr:hypothetical protein [Phototrophicaceae bacterium]
MTDTPTVTQKTAADWQVLLEAEAREQQVICERIAVAQDMRQRFFDLYVRPYDDEITGLRARSEAVHAALEDMARLHSLATGERAFHPSIIVRAKPQTWTYNDGEVLKCLKFAGVAALIRVKEEINRVELNKALRKGQYLWLPVIADPPELTVTIMPIVVLEREANRVG